VPPCSRRNKEEELLIGDFVEEKYRSTLLNNSDYSANFHEFVTIILIAPKN